MNSDIVLAVRACRLEGNALTTLKEDLRFLAQPGRNLTLDLSAVERVTAAYFELLRVHRQLPINPATPIALPLAA